MTQQTCSCGGIVIYARGMCRHCYERHIKADKPPCICGKQQHARGMCRSCYDKWLKENNPEYAERQKENRRRWYRNDPCRLKETNNKWVQNNRCVVREHHSRWKKMHPEQVAVDNHRRRVRVTKSLGVYTAEQWDKICNFYGNMCLRCGNNTNITVDHVVPLSSGGTNSVSNLQPLCRSCNAKKHTNTADYRPDLGAYALMVENETGDKT